MSLTKEEWFVLFNKRCNEMKKKYPNWSQEKIKFMVKPDMPDFPQTAMEKSEVRT